MPSPKRETPRPVTVGFALVPPPDALEATVAAQAILDAGADHEKARDAAEFLVEHGLRYPQALVEAARWLGAHASDFDGWPDLLMRLASAATASGSSVSGDFLTEMATEADDPLVRATARYFAATGLAAGVNDPSTAAADREASRQQALALATGMSAGVEGEDFVKKVSVDGEMVAPTMAQAEAALVHGIRHTLVGSTVADESAQRLDGTEDNLSAYAGKVVLMDFWANVVRTVHRCPAQDAGPGGMRTPDERFEILGISVDAELETVTDFMEDEPMPWAHWHVGVGSELGLSWNIAGYPTYVVVDGDRRDPVKRSRPGRRHQGDRSGPRRGAVGTLVDAVRKHRGRAESRWTSSPPRTSVALRLHEPPSDTMAGSASGIPTHATPSRLSRVVDPRDRLLRRGRNRAAERSFRDLRLSGNSSPLGRRTCRRSVRPPSVLPRCWTGCLPGGSRSRYTRPRNWCPRSRSSTRLPVERRKWATALPTTGAARCPSPRCSPRRRSA